MTPFARATVLVLLLVLGPAGPSWSAVAAAGEEPVPVGQWPLRPAPAVVRGFDPPDVGWGAGHRGVDLLGSPGAGVRAALPGTVSFAGTVPVAGSWWSTTARPVRRTSRCWRRSTVAGRSRPAR